MSKDNEKVNGSVIVMMKEIRLLFKSKRRIGLLLMMPILILIGGLITAGSIYFMDDTVDQTNVWVIDESTGEYSGNLIALWSTINNTNLETITGDYNEIITSLEFEVIILIPNNYSTLVDANITAPVYISYNGNETSNQNVAFTIFQLTEIYDVTMVQLLNPDVQFDLIDTSINEVVESDDNAVDEEVAQILVIIPVYIIFFVVISPISLVLISVTIEREQKTLETLFLQPVKRKSIILGKILYGLFLVLFTLILDIIAGVIIAILVTAASKSKISNDETDVLTDIVSDSGFGAEEMIVFFLGIATIAIVIIALSVLLSLLAKDEKEANMISGIIPMLIMVMAFLIFVIPLADMGVVGQYVMASIPIFGIIVAIFLSTLAGGVVALSYVALAAQIFWAFVIIGITARISEAESILELSYGKAFRELKNSIFRKKKK